jgi:hypothetical protein
VYTFTRGLSTEFDKLRKEHEDLIAQYDKTLEQAKWDIQAANARLAQSRRINSNLAILGLMPNYNPPQTINLNVSDCTKLPALCAGKQ